MPTVVAALEVGIDMGEHVVVHGAEGGVGTILHALVEGLNDAVFEVDASGTQVGSSYIYATTRDYARFALLYLNDGVFNGERILPEGWVNYSRSIVPNTKGAYGAGFWLNQMGTYPSGPKNTFECRGHDGQRIFILPDKDLAVIVLGYSPKKSMDFDALLRDVQTALQ